LSRIFGDISFSKQIKLFLSAVRIFQTLKTSENSFREPPEIREDKRKAEEKPALGTKCNFKD